MRGKDVKNAIAARGYNVSEVARKLGMSQPNLSKQLTSDDVKTGLLERIAAAIGVPVTYFFGGEGETLRSPQPGGEVRTASTDGVPFFSDMPVSAGKAGLVETGTGEDAVGLIRIAGVQGKYAFPVIGCSMEPVIHAGDIVVVDELDRWDKIDPDKIYLILTREDRMIKHLETDEENDGILWCVSPNYRRFSISKDEVLRIYKVTFYGRPV